MGIIDLFSDSNEREAADVVDKGYRKGYRKAKKELGKGFRGLRKDYARAIRGLEESEATARGDVIAGRDAALAEYDPFVEASAPAAGLYSDALGLGGDAGRDRAEAAFRTSPGYGFRMDQGMQALQRLNASRGRLDSGNTMIDAMTYAGGLADEEYGGWLDRLMGERDFGATVAGQRAGIRTGTGGALADITTGTGARTAAVRTGRGDARMGLGERMADLGYATRLGRAGVQADYLAGQDDSGSNLFGMLGGGVSTAAKILGL